jgi:hypothetical protein
MTEEYDETLAVRRFSAVEQMLMIRPGESGMQ